MSKGRSFAYRLAGLLLLSLGVFTAYWWFYKLAPMRRLSEEEKCLMCFEKSAGTGKVSVSVSCRKVQGSDLRILYAGM